MLQTLIRPFEEGLQLKRNTQKTRDTKAKLTEGRHCIGRHVQATATTFYILDVKTEQLSKSNYHSLYLSQYESMPRLPSLVSEQLCKAESIRTGLKERF